MLTKSQIKAIRKTKPMTAQDHLIIELLDELDEAKKIFRDMQKLKDNPNTGIFNFQTMNRINEAAKFLEKYDKE